MPVYKRLAVPPELYKVLSQLSKRDGRSPWVIVREALRMYAHIYKEARPKVEGCTPRRGRPPRA